jgi:LPXTG-motif cell wall-anchored protein
MADPNTSNTNTVLIVILIIIVLLGGFWLYRNYGAAEVGDDNGSETILDLNIGGGSDGEGSSGAENQGSLNY